MQDQEPQERRLTVPRDLDGKRLDQVLTRVGRERLPATALPMGVPELRVRILFNPALQSRWFMLPAILAMVLAVITMLLSAVAVVKEREKGTIEQLVVTPIQPLELIVGKLLPFVVVGAVVAVLVTLATVLVFGVPLRGSPLLLAGMAMLFVLSTLGLGLLASTVSRTQQQAMLAAMLILLPSFLLGGVFYPISNMPDWAQWIANLTPIRYFVVMVRAVFLKGAGLESLWWETSILALIGVVVLLRMLRPERLMDASNFESLAAYAAELQAPVPLLFPPRWAVDVLEATLRGRPMPWVELALLTTGGIAAMAVARWTTTVFYDEGRSRAQSARSARLAKAGWLDTVLGLWTRPLPPVARAIVVKDVKTFVRDPSQWSQVFLVGAIVVIALVSAAAMPTDFMRGPYGAYMREGLAFGAMALVGFIMASVATRFQFTSTSLEGRAFWVVRTGPITAEQLLWAKVWPSLVPMVLVGEVMGISITYILGAGRFLIAISAFTSFFLALGISGLAVGVGAVYPDFKADNAARVAASPAAMVFMVSALVLVFVVAAIELLPVGLWMFVRFQERSPDALEWLGIIGPLVAVAGLCVAAMVVPLRWGARQLWARELPNS